MIPWGRCNMALLLFLDWISPYDTIKLISRTMELWERVVEHHLRMMTTVFENHFGFMPC